jgi:hypothetical protein
VGCTPHFMPHIPLWVGGRDNLIQSCESPASKRTWAVSKVTFETAPNLPPNGATRREQNMRLPPSIGWRWLVLVIFKSCFGHPSSGQASAKQYNQSKIMYTVFIFEKTRTLCPVTVGSLKNKSKRRRLPGAGGKHDRSHRCRRASWKCTGA